MSRLFILIPAAGRSSRMRGRDKLLEPVEGQPLLRRQVRLALGLRLPVMVTMSNDRPARGAALDGLNGVHRAVVTDANEGISASIRAGASWALAQGARGMMILLADLPELTLDDLKKLAQAHEKTPETVFRATDATGKPGHPVILPARLFGKLQALRGDDGAKPLLQSEAVTRIALPGRHATTDLDTPEDWAAWRERQEKPGP
ncbi:nucleotidyltransferase family protein [Roseovarius sp.]|uniref:nucleotidyltransferase family protein n=1 Tax=Roseovarius sp. TaxID=1486281 RepID=UPI00261C6704|nr:nucleotidyltransferase family protein [Roseovarius sp.]MDM8165559.1 nucleotidyltransferase family protein [Roseovarius sp.]